MPYIPLYKKRNFIETISDSWLFLTRESGNLFKILLPIWVVVLILQLAFIVYLNPILTKTVFFSFESQLTWENVNFYYILFTSFSIPFKIISMSINGYFLYDYIFARTVNRQDYEKKSSYKFPALRYFWRILLVTALFVGFVFMLIIAYIFITKPVFQSFSEFGYLVYHLDLCAEFCLNLLVGLFLPIFILEKRNVVQSLKKAFGVVGNKRWVLAFVTGLLYVILSAQFYLSSLPQFFQFPLGVALQFLSNILIMFFSYFYIFTYGAVIAEKENRYEKEDWEISIDELGEINTLE